MDNINPDNIRTILIMSNTAIGDTLFTTPAFKLIKEHYPNKKIVALLNPVNHQIFETNPYIDDIVLYRGKWRNFFKVATELRKKSIDLTLIMHSNEPQATPLAYVSGSSHIVKIPNDSNEFNFLHANGISKKEPGEHFIDRRLRQLHCLGIDQKSYEMQIFPSQDWYTKAKSLLDKQCQYIGFQIGASTKSRMWKNELWVELGRKILEFNQNTCLILTGAQSDIEATQYVADALNSNKVINASGTLDLRSATALIGELDLLVTVDTGPLHIAAALKTPTVALSVAGKAVESNPRDDVIPHVFIEKPETCDPCIDKRCNYARCMEKISADEVFFHVKKLI